MPVSIRHVLAAIAVLGLAACAPANKPMMADAKPAAAGKKMADKKEMTDKKPMAAKDGMIAIATKADYLEFVAGRKTLYEGGWNISSPDGTWHGEHKGKEMSGTWRWEDRYMCRKGTWGGKPIKENCLTMTRSEDGKKLTATRDRGKGRVTHARLAEG